MTDPRAHDERHRLPVTWFELFFDLVMVAALVSMNDSFLAHPSFVSAATAGAAAAALFTVWLLTTLAVNRFPKDDLAHRALMLGQMACVAVAALAVDQDAGLDNEYGLIAYGIGLFLVGFIYAVAPRRHDDRTRSEQFSLLALGIAGVIAIVGALFPADRAWIFLALATLVAIVPMATVYETTMTQQHPLEPRHLSERMGLFVLMVLGLSFGQLVVELGGKNTIPDIRFFILMFVFMFALWWLYFGLDVQEHPVLESRSRHVWIGAHYLLLIGIAGIGDVIAALTAHPDGDPLYDGAAFLGAALVATLVGFAVLLLTVDGFGRASAFLLIGLAIALLGYNVLVDLGDLQDLRVATLVSTVVVMCGALVLALLRRRKPNTPNVSPHQSAR